MKPRTTIILSLLLLLVCVSYVVPSGSGWVVNPESVLERLDVKGTFDSATREQPVQIRFLGVTPSFSEVSPSFRTWLIEHELLRGKKQYSRFINPFATVPEVKEYAVFAVKNKLSEPVTFYGDTSEPYLWQFMLTDTVWSQYGRRRICYTTNRPFRMLPFEQLLLCTILPPDSLPWIVTLRNDEGYYNSDIIMRKQ